MINGITSKGELRLVRVLDGRRALRIIAPCNRRLSRNIFSNRLPPSVRRELYKNERFIGTPQGTRIRLADGREVLNLCANNYLGLAQHPEVRRAAHEALDRWGYGLASVRFICGTQSVHKELETKLSEFLETEDTILYSSCFDANGGLFETLLGSGGRGHFR